MIQWTNVVVLLQLCNLSGRIRIEPYFLKGDARQLVVHCGFHVAEARCMA